MRTNLTFTPQYPTTTQAHTRVNVYDKIVENLYVGGKESSQNAWNEFKLIVNCTKDISFPSQSLGMSTPECIRISVNDTPDESDRMSQLMIETNVLERINECMRKGGKVLVHCYAGMQRSCAVIACYLIKYFKINSFMAIDYVKKKRPVAFFGGVNFMQTILDQTK